jgi:hypothetical protein
MNAKQVTVALAMVFGVALTVVVVKEMSTEAMAVIIGVVCGIAAGIPTSVLLLLALTRRNRRQIDETEQEGAYGARNYPPVVVIQGGTPPALPQGPQAGYWPAPQPGPRVSREFKVVGGDDLLLDG